MSLTGKDLDNIQQLIEVIFDQKLDDKLKEKLSNIPSKDEFFTAMDKIMKELKDIREDKTIMAHQVSRLNDEVEIIKHKLSLPL